MTILNLTMHPASREQQLVGVVDLEDQRGLKATLNFEELPTARELNHVARNLRVLADESGIEYHSVMLGGAPWLMPILADHFKHGGIKVVFAFSKRVSEEKVIDGKTIKTSIFKHLGFVEI
tara:strand:+ start:3365 stop:3727 length:363 start_codon:yes stop_codon:yes gene_type:complete